MTKHRHQASGKTLLWVALLSLPCQSVLLAGHRVPSLYSSDTVTPPALESAWAYRPKRRKHGKSTEEEEEHQGDAPVQSSSLHAAEVAGTASNEGVGGAAVGLQGHVEHDAEQAQGTPQLAHICQGADEGVEGGLLHGAVLAGQRLHQLYRLIKPVMSTSR